MRSFETVCAEPPHCLSGAFGQLVRTLRTNRENIPHKTQTAYIRPWNRLNQDTKQAGSASNGACFYQLPKLSENKKNQYFLAWIEKKAYLCTAASWPIVGKRAVKILFEETFSNVCRCRARTSQIPNLQQADDNRSVYVVRFIAIL